MQLRTTIYQINKYLDDAELESDNCIHGLIASILKYGPNGDVTKLITNSKCSSEPEFVNYRSGLYNKINSGDFNKDYYEYKIKFYKNIWKGMKHDEDVENLEDLMGGSMLQPPGTPPLMRGITRPRESLSRSPNSMDGTRKRQRR